MYDDIWVSNNGIDFYHGSETMIYYQEFILKQAEPSILQ